jgi:outer membrane murein-binding lipoprotein Lpp
MSDAWQLAESFERTRHLIAAINTLSVHTKLSLAGVPDPQKQDDVESATSLLRAFLEKLAGDLSQFEKDTSSPVTGATARANLLARRFATSRNQAPESSPIYSTPLPQFISLLESHTRADQATLVSGLQTLRDLLEQLHHADSSEMLGNL